MTYHKANMEKGHGKNTHKAPMKMQMSDEKSHTKMMSAKEMEKKHKQHY